MPEVGSEVRSDQRIKGTGFFGALPFAWSLLIVPILATMALDAMPEFVPWLIPWVLLPLLPYITLTTLLVKRGVPVIDANTAPSQLIWHTAILWAWAISYPVLVVLTVWSVANSPTLTVYERFALVFILVQLSVFCVGVAHEMLHRREKWTRRLGDFLMGLMAMPHWYTEHVYVHHPHAATPADWTRTSQGESFYAYLLRTGLRTYVEAVRVQDERMARRGLSVWHRSSPCWRWAAVLAAWIGMSLAISGWLGFAVWILQAFHGIYTLRVVDYIQHYGLQRRQLPGGRYEKIQPHHSWNFSNATDFFMFSGQRHSDHHRHPTRPYPLLQEYSEETAPRLPSDYRAMAFLALRPSAWFRTMNPLIAEWRKKFYPDIEDWRAHSSRALRQHPTSFVLINEIVAGAPRVAEWVEKLPVLLDELASRDFEQLTIPENIGMDPAEMLVAQRGLLRLYYTREFGREEMSEQLGLSGVETVEEVVETVQYWSNAQTLQVGVRTMRGHILPVDAGTPLSNVADVAISAVAEGVFDEFVARHGPIRGSAIAIAALGRLGDRRTVMGSEVELLLLYEDADPERGVPRIHVDALYDRLNQLFADLARGSMLFRSIEVRGPGARGGNASGSLEAFADEERSTDTLQRLAEVGSARLVHIAGERSEGIARRFDTVKQSILARYRGSVTLQLREQRALAKPENPTLSTIANGPGGLGDVMLTAFLLRLLAAERHPSIGQAEGIPAVFDAAAKEEIIDAQAAEHLMDAARLWLNVDGAWQLVEDGKPNENDLTEPCRETVVRACDMNGIDELRVAAIETAGRAIVHIDTLIDTASKDLHQDSVA